MSCSIIPQIKDSQGDLKDSRLFNDLLSITDKRAVARDIYLKTKNPDFIKLAESFSRDELGEYKLYDLLTKTNIFDKVNPKKVVDYIKNIANPDGKLTYTKENERLINSRANLFNNTSEFNNLFLAKPVHKNGTIDISIIDKNKSTSEESVKRQYQSSLSDKLAGILSEVGVEIGDLTDAEERMGIRGITEFDRAKTNAESALTLIRLAKGEKGEQALPEEFAHVAIATLGDNPLVSRLRNSLDNDEVLKKIFKEEYDAYNTTYNKDRGKLIEEAMGKAVADKLNDENSYKGNFFSRLLTRVTDAIKRIFSKLNPNSIYNAMAEADKLSGELAKKLLSGSMTREMSLDKVKSNEHFYSLNSVIEDYKKTLEDMIVNEKKRLIIYQKRGKSKTFTPKQEKLIENLEENLDKNQLSLGFVTLLNSAIVNLNLLNKRITETNKNGTTANKQAKVLMDINNYIKSYRGTISTLRGIIREDKASGGNMVEIDKLEPLIDQTSLLMDNLESDLHRLAKPLFISFLDKYIGERMIPFGKEKGKVINAETIFASADRDISMFDLLLDSAAESSDEMIRAIDNIIKDQKEEARLNLIDFIKRVEAMDNKARKSGIKNFEWMYEEDSDGKLRYIEDDSNLTDAQKEYLEEFINLKSELDSLLPNIKDSHQAIIIRKDLLERLKNADNTQTALDIAKQSFQDLYKRRSDDSEFGNKSVITDFEGNRVQFLPVFYTGMFEGEDSKNISRDTTSTLIQYASMALNYEAMHDVLYILELGRDLMVDGHQRQIKQTVGGKNIIDKAREKMKGEKQFLTKSGRGTNFARRLDHLYSMALYGEISKDEGTFFKSSIDKAKVGNSLIALTAMNSLAINILSGVANVATGTVRMNIEAAANQFFSPSELFNADSKYFSNIFEYMGELGKNVRSSKLYLFNEMFNVMQEHERDVRDKNFDRSRIGKFMSLDSLFFLNNIGEHWMQTRTALSLAMNYKMKDTNGNIVSLWDALEVKYTDPSDPNSGGKLEIKEGYRKVKLDENGNYVDDGEFTRDDIKNFTRRSKTINQQMHGIYNTLDKNVIQRYSIGRMVMNFRKYLKPSLNKRFNTTKFNYDLREWTEGYYRTLGRFIVQCASDLKAGNLYIAGRYAELTQAEKKNIARAYTELLHLVAILGLIKFAPFPDKEESTYMSNMFEYQLRRLYTEVGSLVPGPSMITEMYKLIDSPAASMNTLEKIGNLINLVNYNNYETFNGDDAILDSGPYKGMSVAEKSILDITPYRTLKRGLDPALGIPFYK